MAGRSSRGTSWLLEKRIPDRVHDPLGERVHIIDVDHREMAELLLVRVSYGTVELFRAPASRALLGFGQQATVGCLQHDAASPAPAFPSAVAPFGGGSSVSGGVESKRNGHKGAVTIDLRQMGKVKEVDKTSRAALIEGGTYGPALEAQLRPHSLTLRHFPQSFEYSTLGGWIATRAGGHFATSIRTSTISSNRCAPSRREA